MLSTTLRVRWCTDHNPRLGEKFQGYTTEEEARNAWNAWWVKVYDKLPSCRAPGEPLPVLVDEQGVTVGLLSRAALAVQCEDVRCQN